MKFCKLFLSVVLGNKYGHRLAYVAISVNTTLPALSLGYEEGLPIYRSWEKYVTNKVRETGFQLITSRYSRERNWVWLADDITILRSYGFHSLQSSAWFQLEC